MEYINGITEVANPLLIIAPIILMSLSGYAIGNLMSRVRKVNSYFLRDFTSGNLILNFLFIFGFIIFGVLTSMAKAYFFCFTIILAILSILAIYLLLKSFSLKGSRISDLHSSKTYIPILLGIVLFGTLIAYHAIVIYYHSIFEEYDAIYNYLLSSKSILLDNGLHHDYYRGTDIPIRSPPLENALNAWIIDGFGYSSMRLFPIYFVLFASLFVFRFAQRVTNDSFLGWIAAVAFLITPSTLIISSRFSLFNDLSFILFLIASFYFLTEIISQKKIAKTSLLMLMTSLALMPLSREFGLILSFAVFFITLSAKLSRGKKSKVLFAVLALLPLYGITFYDLHNYGVTIILLIRLATVFIINVALLYVLSRVKEEEKSGLGFSHFIYFIPLIAPIIFVSINVAEIHGPYPIMILTQNEQTSINTFREVFGIQNGVLLQISDAVASIPRMDILFTASALGSLFIFFKLRGFITLVRRLKIDSNYVGILAGFMLLLVVWSYFDLGFESASIRHIGYFAPIFAVILVLGMGNRRGIYYKLFFYGIIVFSTYYFLFNDIQIFNYGDRFGSFWIDSYKSNIITLLAFELAAVLILSLIVLERKEHKLARIFNKNNLHWFSTYRFLVPVLATFVVLLGLHALTLVSTDITIESLQHVDQTPQPGWEANVFDVINYLRHGEDGNVLSLRAPAIPFFTNRTDFDLFDPHTFANISPMLQTENSTLLKQRISEMNIRYIVLPNAQSSLYNITQKMDQSYNAINIMNTDADFLKLDMKSYTIYKFGGSHGLDLLASNQSWSPFAYAHLSRDNGTLTILAQTKDAAKSYNRAALETELVSQSPLLLTLTYSSESIEGTAIFYIDITDKKTGGLVWDNVLDNTDGTFVTQTFQLPAQAVGTPVEIRLYAISEGPGYHILTIKNAHVIPT